MRFGYACPFVDGHEAVEDFPIGRAPGFAPCSEHGLMSARVYDVPYFVEDRRHMRRTEPTKNAPTEDWSWAIGAPRPKSRSEARAIEKALGIEFVSPAEAKADAQKLREFGQPVGHGANPSRPGLRARGRTAMILVTPPSPGSHNLTT